MQFFTTARLREHNNLDQHFLCIIPLHSSLMHTMNVLRNFHSHVIVIPIIMIFTTAICHYRSSSSSLHIACTIPTPLRFIKLSLYNGNLSLSIPRDLPMLLLLSSIFTVHNKKKLTRVEK